MDQHDQENGEETVQPELAETRDKKLDGKQLVQPKPHTSKLVPNPSIICHMMDIAEPLTSLKKALQQRLQCNLKDHDIYLQNDKLMDEDKSLLEQGIDAEGTLQFNVEVISAQGVKPKMNIVDVIKPITVEVAVDPPTEVDQTGKSKWVVCNSYRQVQEKMGIPLDPRQWGKEHTLHWLRWAVNEFKIMELIVPVSLQVDGKQLCAFTKEEFVGKMPKSAGELFWFHLDLLKKNNEGHGRPPDRPLRITPFGSDDKLNSHGNRTGNNGQIQLWQFLLELLTDPSMQHCITWVGTEGEFKLLDAELVAQKWGDRKNKPTMNYEKLSRALRYYYDGDMIAKVHGKRFVYQFVCDLHHLLGYSAAEISERVSSCNKYKPTKLAGEKITNPDDSYDTQKYFIDKVMSSLCKKL